MLSITDYYNEKGSYMPLNVLHQQKNDVQQGLITQRYKIDAMAYERLQHSMQRSEFDASKTYLGATSIADDYSFIKNQFAFTYRSPSVTKLPQVPGLHATLNGLDLPDPVGGQATVRDLLNRIHIVGQVKQSRQAGDFEGPGSTITVAIQGSTSFMNNDGTATERIRCGDYVYLCPPRVGTATDFFTLLDQPLDEYRITRKRLDFMFKGVSLDKILQPTAVSTEQEWKDYQLFRRMIVGQCQEGAEPGEPGIMLIYNAGYQ